MVIRVRDGHWLEALVLGVATSLVGPLGCGGGTDATGPDSLGDAGAPDAVESEQSPSANAGGGPGTGSDDGAAGGASEQGSAGKGPAVSDPANGGTFTVEPSGAGGEALTGPEQPAGGGGTLSGGAGGTGTSAAGVAGTGGSNGSGGATSSGGTNSSGGSTSSSGGAMGGDAGAGGGSGGSSQKPVSCDDLSCPDLGTCTVIHDGDVCSRVCQFDDPYLVRTDEEALRLAELECEIVEGDLSFSSDHDAAQPLADLSTIREVTGSVRASVALWLQGLSGLKRIGCVLSVNTYLGTELELPSLSYVGVGLALNETAQLEAASFPSLLEVGFGETDTCGSGYVPMGLLLAINEDLVLLDMPALQRVSERVYIAESPKLEAVCVPSLTEVFPSDGTATEITQQVLSSPTICLSTELSDTLGREDACPPALCQ